MKIARSVLPVIFFLGSVIVYGQRSGSLLDMPLTAVQLALNQANVASLDSTHGGYAFQPSLVDSNSFALISYTIMPSKASRLSGVYLWERPRHNIQLEWGYMGIRNQTSYDEYENVIGTFSTSDLMIKTGTNYVFSERLQAGIKLGFAYSNYDGYTSGYLSSDVGLHYHKPTSTWAYGLLLRNLGFQLWKFHDERDKLPVNLSVGLSKRFEHLPLRLYASYQHLERWNLSFDNDYYETSFINQDPNREDSFGSLFFRHFVFGTDIYFGARKNFGLMASMDMLKRRNASINSVRSMAGLGLGFLFRSKGFDFQYALSIDHPIAQTHQITLQYDLRPRKNF